MIDELKKSVSGVLYERLTSPLAGTFFLSWFIWNWKILYLLFFSDKSMTLINRIQYVETNYFSVKQLFIIPVLSTIAILLIYPIPSLGSYYLWAKFKYWKNSIKNHIEKNVLLTKEESISIRLKMEESKNEFAHIIDVKEKDIEILKKKLGAYENDEKENKKGGVVIPEHLKEDMWGKEFNKLVSQPKVFEYFSNLSKQVHAGYSIPAHIVPTEVLGYYISNEIIEETEKRGIYKFTEKGKYILKKYSETV